MSDKKLAPVPIGDETEFYRQVSDLLAAARQFAKRQLDNTIVVAYYEIGRMIVEHEQHGQKRAQYGARLMKGLSEYLVEQYGRGFSVANLKNIRNFYQVYSPSIQKALSAQSGEGQSMSDEFEKSQSLISLFAVNAQKGQSLSAQFNLSWTHYQILMRIDNEAARRFYEIETVKQQWTVRQLQRQVGSSLYERLVLSRDKDKVMALANEGQSVQNPRDIFKSPYILEFTGLEERAEYSESELEQALIDNLQKFLLELGKGFLFEARQKRFSFDEKSFYVDLVFYNRLLQCYVIIDLKIAELRIGLKITYASIYKISAILWIFANRLAEVIFQRSLKHQDIGQMLMYVNYFDRYVKQEFEKPTVGILLCSQKNDNIVELTLPEDSNIYASQYSLYLPDKDLLQCKLAEWIEEFEEVHGGDGQ